MILIILFVFTFIAYTSIFLFYVTRDEVRLQLLGRSKFIYLTLGILTLFFQLFSCYLTFFSLLALSGMFLLCHLLVYGNLPDEDITAEARRKSILSDTAGYIMWGVRDTVIEIEEVVD